MRPGAPLTVTALFALGALVVAGPGDLNAQLAPPSSDAHEGRPAADSVAEESGGSSFRGRLMAVGGVTGIGGDGIHPYGGLEGGFLLGRFGALGLGQYGTGNGFSSLLFGGGPAVEVVDLGYAAVTAYGGLAWYREELDAVPGTREVTGLYGGLSVRVPLPFGALGFNASLWRGSVEGEGIEFDHTPTSHRFSVGFGF